MRLVLILLAISLFCSPAFGQAPPAPDAEARCAVCGMFVAPYSSWIAALQMDDGRTYYFDGPKDMFIFFSDLAKYLPGASTDQVQNLFVTEYYSAETVPAAEVFFVIGSDVLGPMGKELVPVAGRQAAEIFRRDHGGKKLMRFEAGELVEVPDQP